VQSNNAHYMSITPHQATSKVVTQKRAIRRASIVRRGIGAEFENDFIKTPLGRASYIAALGQIARSVQETANVEVLRALINCHRHQQQLYRTTQVASYLDLDEKHKREASRFMCAQKEKFGLERITTEIDADMEAVGGKADVWILSADVSNYIRTTRDEKTDYNLGGQEAVDRINGRSSLKTIARGNTMGVTNSIEPYGSVAGQEVYLARSYQIDNGIQLDLLSRTMELGIFNTMVDRTRDYSKYRSAGRNIQVYDNDRDDWTEIELIEAIQNCSCWNARTGEIETNSWQKQAGSNASLHSDDNDFLSQPVKGQPGKRENIKYVGDMAPVFLKSEHTQNAAQTLLNALKKSGFEDKTYVAQASGTSIADHVAALGALSQRVRQLLGEGNLFFKDADVSAAAGRPTSRQTVNARIAALMTLDTHDIVVNSPVSNVQVGSSASASAEAEEATQFFLKDVLGVAVPATHKAELEAIASKTSTPWTDRAQAVRNLVAKCSTEDPNSVPALKTVAKLDHWYNSRLNTEKETIAARVASSTASAAARNAAVEHEYHFVPAGTRLQAGQTLVHAASSGNVIDRLVAVSKPAASHTGVGNTPIGRGLGSTARGAPGATGGGVTREQFKADNLERSTEGDNFQRNMARINSHGSTSSLMRALAILYLGTPFNRDTFINYAQNNIYVPLGFLLFRPHCQYRTRYGIRCAAGGGAGYTLFGHSDMQLGTAASNKVGLMHYTEYLSAIVMFPQNVYILEDLFCKKYLGGMGVSWWDPETYRRSTNRRFRSIICAPLPPSRKNFSSNKMDIRGRWYTDMKLGLINSEDAHQVHYEGCQRLCAQYQLMDATRKNQQSNRSKTPPNSLCWQGIEWYFNTKTNCYDSLTIEAGHFGAYVYPQCGKVRNGVKKMLIENGHKM
jgi:hypothetical protein